MGRPVFKRRSQTSSEASNCYSDIGYASRVDVGTAVPPSTDLEFSLRSHSSGVNPDSDISNSQASAAPAAAKKKCRGGRPALPSDVKKEAFKIRISAQERELIQVKADASGMSFSDFIRTAAGIADVKPAVPAINRLAYGELIRIGSNLNQLARVANSSGQVREAEILAAAIAELRLAAKGLLG